MRDRDITACTPYKNVVSLFFYPGREGTKIADKIFDKEYATQYPLEMLYLKENGISYTFVKTERGVTVWKFKKSYKLFDTLKNFYKNQ